jgi:hypothetical protein
MVATTMLDTTMKELTKPKQRSGRATPFGFGGVKGWELRANFGSCDDVFFPGPLKVRI